MYSEQISAKNTINGARNLKPHHIKIRSRADLNRLDVIIRHFNHCATALPFLCYHIDLKFNTYLRLATSILFIGLPGGAGTSNDSGFGFLK